MAYDISVCSIGIQPWYYVVRHIVCGTAHVYTIVQVETAAGGMEWQLSYIEMLPCQVSCLFGQVFPTKQQMSLPIRTSVLSTTVVHNMDIIQSRKMSYNSAIVSYT